MAGALDDNHVYEPSHKLYQEVPDQPIRGYFLLDDAIARTSWTCSSGGSSGWASRSAS